MSADPTDGELDEWERQLADQEWAQSTKTVVSRLTKALRACRRKSKAKDAALERISKRPHSGDAAHPGPHGRKYCNCHVGIALAALDNLPSAAKQGETDDAE